MALTKEQKSQAQALGLDLGKLDWSKVIQIIQLLVALFGGSAPQGAKGPKVDAASLKQKLKDAGCPDEDADCACDCCTAGMFALHAAMISFQCCQDTCEV